VWCVCYVSYLKIVVWLYQYQYYIQLVLLQLPTLREGSDVVFDFEDLKICEHNIFVWPAPHNDGGLLFTPPLHWRSRMNSGVVCNIRSIDIQSS